ncbi:ABC transporter ATP-binding protein [Pseudaminobacter sp. 19-2017]|uniref:ABC transporter ATP-binding protein n=1 Tax=Pseudaminobacter soli (ex Zhang et al. 2022) TaxID=2831468 RepID=A0A942E2W7_9HYPH|nr:ABC transporter ATP-binding protein [Pseudaminobacter soli]MBS3652138.1 ABC transporter ATP-binding protein [Pseudaminobacter soli]
MSFLVVDSLTMTYGPLRALNDVSLTVKEGEFISLLGPSGSGKTTLLMSLAGFNKPTSGRILLDGQDIIAREPEDRDFGFVFQGYALFPHLSVSGNIAFPLKVRKWDAVRIRARVEEMLALVGLKSLADRKPRQLSGGQQQRVALARALSFGPRVLLLDEPLSALDRMLREQMQTELRRLHRETGVTFLYVTHDQQEALTMSDRIAVFEKGKIVEEGSPTRLFKSPTTRFVAEFLGENNFVKGSRANGVWQGFGTSFSLPEQRDSGEDAGSATLWLRPGDIGFGTGRDGDISFTAKVEDFVFGGTHNRLALRLRSGETFVASISADLVAEDALGKDLTFHARPEAVGVLR